MNTETAFANLDHLEVFVSFKDSGTAIDPVIVRPGEDIQDVVLKASAERGWNPGEISPDVTEHEATAFFKDGRVLYPAIGAEDEVRKHIAKLQAEIDECRAMLTPIDPKYIAFIC